VAQNGDYICYEARTDADVEVSDTDAVEEWLEGREDYARHASSTLLDYASDEDWAAMRRKPHDVSVTWLNDQFSAEVRDVPTPSPALPPHRCVSSRAAPT
jgi:hypothetical protein